MAVTDQMQVVFDRLRNDVQFRQEFAANRQAAIAGFELTAHEHDALITNDCDDFVALGLATTTGGLPSVLDCPEPQRPTTAPGLLDRIRDAIGDVINPIRDRIPLPPFELPRPWGRPPRPDPPDPRPGPDPPTPDPTPGPDPPGPDRPGGGG